MPEPSAPKDFPRSVPPPDSSRQGDRCALCGLPPGNSRLRKTRGEEVLRFCCPGCERVFSLLSASPGGIPKNFRDTDLYRACVESGIIPSETPPFLPPAGGPGESDIPPLRLSLRVGGMWCPACSWLIGEVLRKTRGVLEPRVSFFSDRLEMKYLPHLLSPAEIMEKIARLGYHPSPCPDEETLLREKKNLLVRLGVSAILSAHLMMLSLALYSGFFRDLSAEAIRYLSYPLWLMATPVLLYGGLPILKRGFVALRHGASSMDTLIAIGSLAAYIYSLFQMFRGSMHLYFDTASMLITVVLLGRYVESRARERVSRGITDLYRLAHPKVRLWKPNPGAAAPALTSSLPAAAGSIAPSPLPLTSGESEEGLQERWVSSESLNPGDVFLVKAGETVPLDGRIIAGAGVLDESALTGESRPVNKVPGKGVMAGTLLSGGELIIQATRVGRESSLGQMIALMQEALEKKNPAEVAADRITRWFVPAILAIAGATGLSLGLFHAPGDEILLRSLTVLVIACPCALGIATPLVKLASVGLAKSRGILVRDPAALEAMKDLDVLVFDKTGTLTEGDYSLREVVPSKGMEAGRVLSLAAAVEARSSHFLARETVRKAREASLPFEEAADHETLEGMGVRGRVDGLEILVGNRRLMARENLTVDPVQEEKAQAAEARGMTAVFAGWAGRARGLLLFGDSLRPGISGMVRDLHARGISTWLVSGDSRETTRAIALQSGIPHFRGEILPQEKAGLVESLRAKGHRVGMVGDGINDAPALARADVGVALGTGTNILQEASDLTFLAPDPTRVGVAMELSDLTVRTIRQNLFFAFLYNCIAIPLAVSGWLNPLVAVLAMLISSLMVTGNALRISKAKGFSSTPPASER